MSKLPFIAWNSLRLAATTLLEEFALPVYIHYDITHFMLSVESGGDNVYVMLQKTFESNLDNPIHTLGVPWLTSVIRIIIWLRNNKNTCKHHVNKAHILYNIVLKLSCKEDRMQ